MIVNKKVISILTIFSTLTLFSIGFATWEIIEGAAFKSTETDDRDVVGDDIYSIASIGISYDLSTYPVESFVYYKDVTSGNISFTSTNVYFTVIANKQVFETLDYDNSKAYYLEVELYYDYSSTNTFDLFTSSTYITAPNATEIYLTNMENVAMSSTVEKSKMLTNSSTYRYSLITYIPVKASDVTSLYDLVFMTSGTGDFPITICYPFTNPTNALLTTYFETFKTVEFNFMLTVREK